MNEEPEPFGGCDILEPDIDNRSNASKSKHEEAVQESWVSSTSSPLVRIVKKTQMYIEPHGLSKTVTIEEDHGSKQGTSMEYQPSSSGWPQPTESERGSGSRLLSRLTLRIGQKQMTFKVMDIPPQSQEYSGDWDWNNRLHQAEATLLYAKKQCVQCDRLFNTMEEIRRHISEAHSFRPFPCNYCSKSFLTKGEHAAHLKGHASERPHECPMCNKRFRHSTNLNQHVKLHATGRRHFCNMCGRCFRTSDDLAFHHRRCLTVSEGEGASSGADGRPLRYECSYCGKPFHFKRDRAIHERVHTGEKPFECGYCGRGFTQSQALTSHIRLHTGEKPYSCPVCSKPFRDSSSMRKHESNHYTSVAVIMKDRKRKVEVERESSYDEEAQVADEANEENQYQEEPRPNAMEESEGVLEEVEEEIVEEGEIPIGDEEYYEEYSSQAIIR